MRFFSNDARESTDPDNDPQATDEHPERVQSDPVTVPAQRPPSPWSNTPADDTVNDTDGPGHHEAAEASYGTVTPPPAEAERWGADDSVATTYESDANREAHGAHAADTDEVDLPLDDNDEKSRDTVTADDGTVTDHQATDDSVVEKDDSVTDDTVTDEPGRDDTVVDGPVTEDVTARDDSVFGEADREGTVPEQTTDDETKASENGVLKDETLKDEGGFDDPKAVDPATDETLDDTTASETAKDETATDETDTLGDGTPDTDRDADFVAPAPGATDGPANPPASDYAPISDADAASESASESDSVPDSVPDSVSEESTPVVAAVPVAAAAPATAAAAPAVATLFDAGDAQSYKERWRDVQLRFVDSPKEAADEAATLVSEAVDKLTASLNAQKDGLADETDDTERLRVQIRGYREILNRILSL